MCYIKQTVENIVLQIDNFSILKVTEMKYPRRLRNELKNKTTSLTKTTKLCNILISLIICHLFTTVSSINLVGGKNGRR